MVGHDVWIGYQATVMPGARIGNEAIIASGSVVTGHIPDYGIAGGNPATLIRRRYSDKDITRRDWPGGVPGHSAHHRTYSHHRWPAASTTLKGATGWQNDNGIVGCGWTLLDVMGHDPDRRRASPRHTPQPRTPHGQIAVSTLRGMEYSQVSGHS